MLILQTKASIEKLQNYILEKLSSIDAKNVY